MGADYSMVPVNRWIPETLRAVLPRLVGLAALGVLALPPAAGALAGDAVRPGKWNPKDAPPGWIVIETEHYQVQSQVGEAKARRLAGHLEAMLDQYQEFLPFRKRIKDFVLKIFESHEAMRAYNPGISSGTAAWYSKGQRELVAYDTGVVLGERDIPARIGLRPDVEAGLTPDEIERLAALFDEITDAYTFDVARVLSHEGWHQYFHHYTVSWVSMPSWLDEGVGDYFFMATRVRDGQDDDEARYRVGDVNHARLRVVQKALLDGTTVSFSRMLEFEQKDYYSNPSVFYAQGWSMVHFLMQHEDRKMRELIPELIEDFKDTKNFVKSSDRAFRKLDLDEIDREWIGWLLTAEAEDPLRDLAVEFGSRLEPDDLEVPSESWRALYAWHLEGLAAAAGTGGAGR